jgi:tetratricopeptide (TPR) repeat protein
MKMSRAFERELVTRLVALAGGALTIAVSLTACGGERSSEDTRLVFKDAAGRELTTDDLRGVSGTVRWEVIGAGTVPVEASRLHAEAREAGAHGEYPRALNLLEQAHRLAPDWPYPVYDTAFTYLLQGDSTKAEEYYAQVDRMAPRGFFTAKTSLDCLRREHAGALFPGFCRAFATLESMDSREKRTLLEGIVEKFPAFPAAWKELSSLLEDDNARLRAIGRGLQHDPDADTKGVLLINRAMILHRRNDRDGAVKILGELALDPQSTLATEALAKSALAQIVS